MAYFFGNNDVVPGESFTIHRLPYTSLEVFENWAVRTMIQDTFNYAFDILNTETGDITRIRSREIPIDCQSTFGYGSPSIIQNDDGEFYLKVEDEDGDYILFDLIDFELIDKNIGDFLEIPENPAWEIVDQTFSYCITYQQSMEG
jgi:hypothetical protein